MRSEGFIEDLFVNRTGQHVHAGEKLFRVYSAGDPTGPDRSHLCNARYARAVPGPIADRALEGAMQRLRNLGVPDSRIREVRETGTNPRTLDWVSPASGDVIEKRVVNGQRVMAGEELYRIIDHSHVWVITDVAEGDLAMVKPGTRASVTFRAYPMQPVEGEVTFIYPELRAETRTARVRIEMPNPDGRLKIDMYADVVLQRRRRRETGPNDSDKRVHRQRHTPGRADRQGRGPLRAARGQDSAGGARAMSRSSKAWRKARRWSPQRRF